MATDRVCYPNVYCETHHTTTPGYCVCVHVARDGAPIGHRLDARADALGELLCSSCHAAAAAVGPESLILICGRCVDDIIGADRAGRS
jgi:hypothetical protein